MTAVYGVLPSVPNKWALFDLDWTLVRPSTSPQRQTLSGGPFSFHEDDWSIIPGRIQRLLDFVRESFHVGFVTNQKYTGVRREKAAIRLQRVYDLFKQYIPDIVLMASFDETSQANPQDPASLYRKPGRGWGYHLQFLPGSLYVGDAVQDPSRPERSWGYSDSDRQFAIALGLPYATPEEVFPQLALPPGLFDVPRTVFILVGAPGSGKSTFARTHPDFIHIESDQYKSNWDRMRRALQNALTQGQKVMVDATNPGKARRREIIQMAQSAGVPVGIILFLNSGKWAKHDPTRSRPQIAYNRYWAAFEEPSIDEGAQIYYQT